MSSQPETFTAGYADEISTLQVSPEDMARLGLKNGDRVRIRTPQRQVELRCATAKAGELPAGVFFMPYGDLSSRLMGGDTQGTGMPDSKGMDVTLEKIEATNP
jgi:formylmethanofuran dehydrogenase subunit D